MNLSLVHHGPSDMDMSAPRMRAEDGGGRARHRHPAPEAPRLAGPWPGQQAREAAAPRARQLIDQEIKKTAKRICCAAIGSGNLGFVTFSGDNQINWPMLEM